MDLVTVVGSMAMVNVGSVITIKGFWSSNPKCGKQFDAKEWEEALPASIYGIGFKTTDAVAAKLGIEKDSFKWCRAGLFYTLSQLSEEGHCYAIYEQLVAKCVEILEVEESKNIMSIDHLVIEKEFIKEEPDVVYLPPFYFSEVGVAKRLKQLMFGGYEKKVTDSEKVISLLESKENITYDDIQRNAIREASKSRMMVLTGGPGTGKTTTTHGIITLFKESGMDVVLVVPTGVAAKRVNEANGMEIKYNDWWIKFNINSWNIETLEQDGDKVLRVEI